MKAKNLILFLAFVLLVQIVCKIAPLVAQEDRDILEIKNVITDFLNASNAFDANSAMQHVSSNYRGARGTAYAEFKSITEKHMKILSESYTDLSFSDLEIISSHVIDGTATVEIAFDEKGFNLDTLQQYSEKKIRVVDLAKENGVWKITKWDRRE